MSDGEGEQNSIEFKQEEVEYLESEDENASAGYVTEWTDAAVVRLLKICQTELPRYNNTDDPEFWQQVGRQFNADIPVNMLAEKFNELEATWNRMERSPDGPVKWPFEKEFQILNAIKRENLQTTLIMETLQDYPADSTHVKVYTLDESAEIVNAYRKGLDLVRNKLLKPNQIWRTVLDNLDQHYAVRFTPDDIKHRIGVLMKVFDNNREQPEWPLYLQMKSLVSGEDIKDVDVVASSYNAETEYEDEEEIEGQRSRWRLNDTYKLIGVYKKYLPRLISCSSYKAKGVVWEKIAKEMKMRPEAGGARMARSKMVSLISRWEKVVENPKKNGKKWKFYNEVNWAMMKKNELIDKMKKNIPFRDASMSNDEETNEPEAFVKRKIGRTDLEAEPDWFRDYRIAAKKRHEEKMQVKHKLLSLLEEFLAHS